MALGEPKRRVNRNPQTQLFQDGARPDSWTTVTSLTGGKNHLLHLGKQTIAAPKLMTPNRAYPKIQQVKYEMQNKAVRLLSRGDQSIKRPTSRMPMTVDGPTAAIARSRLILRVSECEGRLGNEDGRRSGSWAGVCVAGCRTCVTCYKSPTLVVVHHHHHAGLAKLRDLRLTVSKRLSMAYSLSSSMPLTTVPSGLSPLISLWAAFVFSTSRLTT